MYKVELCDAIVVEAVSEEEVGLAVVEVVYAYAVLFDASAFVLRFEYIKSSRRVWLNQQKYG